MSAQVDHELLQLYVLGQLDDARSAEVERRVAEDPAWAEALQAEATLEVAMFEVVDAAPAVAVEAPAVAPTPWWVDLWRRLRAPVVGLAMVAGAALLVVRLGPDAAAPSYQLEVHSGEAKVRSSAPAGTPTYTRGSSLSLVLRPATRVVGAPQVQVRLDGAPLDGVHIEALDGGTVEIGGVFGEDLREPGAGEHHVEISVGGQAFDHAFVWRPAAP